MRDLMEKSKRLRDAAFRAYQHMQVTMRRQTIRRETDAEIREALRQHDMGSAAFD